MILVDTSFWVALRNRRDDHHDDAVQLLHKLATAPLVSTNHIVGETWTYLRRRAGHRAAVDFLDYVERSGRLIIERVSQDLESEAMQWLRRHDEREYSFVDATSFAVMRSQRIPGALAFDGDFSAAGFNELRP